MSANNCIVKNATPVPALLYEPFATLSTNALISAVSNTSPIVVSTSDTPISFTDNQTPINFNRVGNTYFYNGQASSIRVFIIATTCAQKIATNLDFQIRINKDLGIGGYSPLMATTQHIDKTEGHNVVVCYVMSLNVGEGILITARTSTSTCNITSYNAVGGLSAPSCQINVFEV